MAAEVYHKLREQLDEYSVGFPATGSGVEIRLLEKLFSEEEAELFLHLSLLLEPAQSVAGRLGRDPARVAALLETMAGKGLVFRLRKGGATKYAAVPYIVGFFEFQVADLDRETAQLMEDYFQEALARQSSQEKVLMRTIPVNKALDVSYQVAPHDDARAIIRSKSKIVLAQCICREWQGKIEAACDKPTEVCFMFGAHADYYLEKGMGRQVSREEALAVLDRCQEAGLVCQPFNAVNPGGMCNCCGDCCGILRSLKLHPRPSEILVSSYYAEVEADECLACGTCLERCQVNALSLNEDDVAQVDLDRCIGCGLCVTTCQEGAISLKLKPEDQRPDLPKSGQETYLRLAQSRGKSLVPLSMRK